MLEFFKGTFVKQKTEQQHTFNEYNLHILSSWPFEKKVNNQRRILIDPKSDSQLTNFLVSLDQTVSRDDHALTKASRANKWVFENVPYNEEFFVSTQKGQDRYLGDYLENGGVCSTKALILHIGLASFGIESKIYHLENTPHDVVVVDSLEMILDPTHNRIETAKSGETLIDLAKRMHGDRKIQTSQYVEPIKSI